MVDKPKLDQMLSNLSRFDGILRTLADTPASEFLSNSDKVGSAKYHLVVAIECCIDVANHIIASEGFRFPKDNADSFNVLVEHGVVDPPLREPLRAMARFRNRLVHLYWDIDDARVHEYLRTSLDDLTRYARSVASREW